MFYDLARSRFVVKELFSSGQCPDEIFYRLQNFLLEVFVFRPIKAEDLSTAFAVELCHVGGAITATHKNHSWIETFQLLENLDVLLRTDRDPD